MLRSVTTPGTKRDSPHHEVIFVRGEQAGIGCYLAEYLMDWTQLMEIILRGLETAASGAGTQDTFRDALAANPIQFQSKPVEKSASREADRAKALEPET